MLYNRKKEFCFILCILKMTISKHKFTAILNSRVIEEINAFCWCNKAFNPSCSIINERQ